MQDTRLRRDVGSAPSQGHQVPAQGGPMFRLINRTTVMFFVTFLVACAGVAVYDAIFVWPEQQCTADGAWWDKKDRECLTPIPIWRLTGRTVVPAAKAPRLSQPRPSPAPPVQKGEAESK